MDSVGNAFLNFSLEHQREDYKESEMVQWHLLPSNIKFK